MNNLKNINEAWLNLDIGDEKVFNPFKIVNFNDDDYLLLTGDPAAIALAAAVAARQNGGRFKMLKWDRQTAKYFPLSANLNIKLGEVNGEL